MAPTAAIPVSLALMANVSPPSPTASTTMAASTTSEGGNNIGNDDDDDDDDSSSTPSGPSTPVVAGIVGGCLGALVLACSGIAAFMTKRKRDCERELEGLQEKVENSEEGPPVLPAPETNGSGKQELYDTGNANETYVERPALISSGMAGHGNSYT